MTVSALTRPGERDRLIVKLSEVDWLFVLVLCLIAGAGALMLFSIAGSSWQPWAAQHALRFGLCLILMVGLAMVDLRVWFALAYPIYGLGVLLLIAVEAVGDVRLGAQRWLSIGAFSFQPSEVIKLGIVLVLPDEGAGKTCQGLGTVWIKGQGGTEAGFGPAPLALPEEDPAGLLHETRGGAGEGFGQGEAGHGGRSLSLLEENVVRHAVGACTGLCGGFEGGQGLPGLVMEPGVEQGLDQF